MLFLLSYIELYRNPSHIYKTILSFICTLCYFLACLTYEAPALTFVVLF